MQGDKEDLCEVYRLLLAHFGPQGWWPGDSSFEIVTGAILTQAVAWKNVEKALMALKDANIFSPQAILETPDEILADLIRPALYHRQKTRKLKEMMNYVQHVYGGDFHRMFLEPMPSLRQDLLSLWGIGSETADSILLYAGGYPIFVVDAYTRRIFSRLGWVDEKISYQAMQEYLEEGLPEDVGLFNEYHALIVALGKGCCKKTRSECANCPLGQKCVYFKSLQE